jgi:hypothetical protein
MTIALVQIWSDNSWFRNFVGIGILCWLQYFKFLYSSETALVLILNETSRARNWDCFKIRHLVEDL